jgi:hypothetical protein
MAFHPPIIYFNKTPKINITINITSPKNMSHQTINLECPSYSNTTPTTKPIFVNTAPINPSALKYILPITADTFTNDTTYTYHMNAKDYINYSGFNVFVANSTIILPDITNLTTNDYISFTIYNSSIDNITIKSNDTKLYNTIFIDPNGSTTYILPSNKIVIANNIYDKTNTKWIWGLIIS